MSTSYPIVLFAAVVGIIPISWWLWVIVRENHFEERGFNFLVEIFFWGVLAAIPASIIEILIVDSGGGGQIISFMQRAAQFVEVPFVFSALFSALLIATIEETSKWFGVLISIGKRKIKNPNTGVVFGMIIGLAFAVTENGVYFATAVQSQETVDFGSVVILRCVLATSAHVVYSGIMGLFFAKARLRKGSSSYYYFVLSFLSPITIHTGFNFLLGGTNSWVVSIVLGVGLLLLWNEYQENRVRYSPKLKLRKKKNEKR